MLAKEQLAAATGAEDSVLSEFWGWHDMYPQMIGKSVLDYEIKLLFTWRFLNLFVLGRSLLSRMRRN